jgi:hypothetical protein
MFITVFAKTGSRNGRHVNGSIAGVSANRSE